MKRGMVVVLVGALTLVTSLTASAQDQAPAEPAPEPDVYHLYPEETEFTRHGAFAALGFSWYISAFQEDLKELDFGNTVGFNARGGYRFFPWFAAEAILEYGDKFGADNPDSSATIESLATTVNAKFILPFQRVQPYLELGGGFLRVASEGTGFATRVGDLSVGAALRIGAGLDVYIDPTWSLYIEDSWTMASKNAPGVYYNSLGGGVRYNF